MEREKQNILYQNMLENQRYGHISANMKEGEAMASLHLKLQSSTMPRGSSLPYFFFFFFLNPSSKSPTWAHAKWLMHSHYVNADSASSLSPSTRVEM